MNAGDVRLFDWSALTPEHLAIAKRYVPDLRAPDLVIDNDDEIGTPYLFRWHCVPRTKPEDFGGNVYFHIQTADDPQRPLHDHPWDNMSVILAGGYVETKLGYQGRETSWIRMPGDVVFRHARELHRLELRRASGVPYSMSQFTTGTKVKDWGFVIEGQFCAYAECHRVEGNRHIFKYPERFKHLEKAS